MRIQLLQPHHDGGQGDEAEDVDRHLVVAGGDPAELLDVGKTPLDMSALLVKVPVAGVGPAPIGRDIGMREPGTGLGMRQSNQSDIVMAKTMLLPRLEPRSER